ncbi:hypothetical protein [Martelella sp. HB161492]|uniref:hypothetical protein n=1 Tax=Martelella sp. HB161492 TaxID=2720726 RepID=UPI0015901298|nr:hypothetical protein [Martelella sp. HB161492]
MAVAFAITTPPIQNHAPTGLKGVAEQISTGLKATENYMVGDVSQALNPNNGLVRLPLPTEQMLNRMESQATTPEQRKIFETIKKNTLDIHARQNDILEQSFSRNIASQKIQLSLKAVSKTMAGIQQLLSSQ